MTDKANKQFVNEFIPRVSRTFALAIKFLPMELRHPVFTAYLLCRVADTIEDSPHIQPDDKRIRLMHLNKLLLSAADGAKTSPNDLTPLYQGINPEHGHDHRLLVESLKLFDVLAELPDEKRKIIYHWAGEMAFGMAEFSQITARHDNQIVAIDNVAQWDRYCYYVAGTVGHMLTELFISEYRFDTNAADGMLRLCDSFGLGLQKVNTIKDVPGDMARGVVFLPKDIMTKYSLTPDLLSDIKYEAPLTDFVRELTEMSGHHLDDAIEYTTFIPERLKGVRMFLAVPVLLARATLNLINKFPVQTMVGPAVKISHADVARLTAMAKLHSPSNAALKKYYSKLKARSPS
ncbi:MAG TPA: hypothetical protein DEO84_09260 [candidate division Zixibacteria bacterium]|nr:hypothetical protein [candidate division Zixibacteria bacterium]